MAKEETVRVWSIVYRAVICGVLLAVIVGIIYYVNREGKAGELTVTAEASLREMVQISELSTVDYTYNATVAQYTEDRSAVKYYVAPTILDVMGLERPAEMDGRTLIVR